jgi:hypothetical protein
MMETAAHAEHNHQFDDFDTGSVPPWWSPDTLATDPNGGFYLGPLASDHAQMLIMDILPAFNPGTGNIDSSPRRLWIQFDVVGTNLPTDSFLLTANGETILDGTFASLLGDYTPSGRETLKGYFKLFSAPFPNSSDLVLDFSRSGLSDEWGLDNVTVDWSRPVPEPASWSLALVGTAGLVGFGLRRSARIRGAIAIQATSKAHARTLEVPTQSARCG